MGIIGSLLSPITTIASAFMGYKGQQDANETNVEQAAINREFNREEAQKNRDFQERMRATQYQTATQDMIAAGINPMVAYTQGGAGTPTGATASSNSLPHVANKATAAVTNSATTATIQNIHAQTEKTEADAEVSRAMADKVRAETNLTTSSTENMNQTVQKTIEEIQLVREQIGKTHAEKYYVGQQTATSWEEQRLKQQQWILAEIEKKLKNGQITLQTAQTELTKIETDLRKYEIAGARNKSASDETWYGRNIRPYLQDAGRITNSATSIYQLKR